MQTNKNDSRKKIWIDLEQEIDSINKEKPPDKEKPCTRSFIIEYHQTFKEI